jgi:hypothetical protein
MATTWADIVSAALVQIDDVRLEEQMSVSPAQFYRRMAALIQQAMPLLSRPPELLTFLKSGMVLPTFDDFEWTSDEESTYGGAEVDTGMIGYELCSVTQRQAHPNGTITLLPYSEASYDPETGIVTLPDQDSAEINYDFDFYTDGEFPDLTETQMRLFALAVAVVWDERFSRNWLSFTTKIHDDSFQTVNEANYIAQVTKRLHDNRIAFNDELRWYEQICAYNGLFKHTFHKTTLV